MIKFPKRNSFHPNITYLPFKCENVQKQNIFYPLWQLPRQKKSFLTSQTYRGRDRKCSTRLLLPFPVRNRAAARHRGEHVRNAGKRKTRAPTFALPPRTGGKKPSQLYREISWRNFHKFRHRASKWLPVERSDIVDNRHVARGEFNIAFAPVLVQLHHFHRLYPPFTLALFHPLCEQRCALLRARYLPLHRSLLSLSLPPPSTQPLPPRIVPRIVPKVFAGAA